MTAYCVNNVSLNFRANQNVYIELKKLNENIVPIGCICHKIYNSMKYAHILADGIKV